MATGDDPKDGKDGNAKGFAGLASLASDVDIPPPPIKKVASPAAASTNSQGGQTTQRQSPSSPYRAPPLPSSGSTEGASTGKWILGLFAVVGVIWIIGANSGKTEVSAPGNSYTPPVQTQPQTQKPQGLAVQKVPAQPTLPAEVQPSAGSNLVLSIPEIQYCLAEEIRMDGAKAALNTYIHQDVDRFNAWVAVYNSRCSNYRYQHGALESARQAIEPFRAQYLAGGRSRFVSRAPERTSSAPSAPNARLYDIQNRLNNLGYHAGTADGYMGLATRNAMLAFQRENGLTADGVAGPELLVQLIQAKPHKTPDTNVSRIESSISRPNQSQPPNSAASKTESTIPANAFASGPYWYCNSGYRKVGDKCEVLIVPQNATSTGANWSCNAGYRQRGDKCEPDGLPPNAWVYGTEWGCNVGYLKVGNECKAR